MTNTPPGHVDRIHLDRIEKPVHIDVHIALYGIERPTQSFAQLRFKKIKALPFFPDLKYHLSVQK